MLFCITMNKHVTWELFFCCMLFEAIKIPQVNNQKNNNKKNATFAFVKFIVNFDV